MPKLTIDGYEIEVPKGTKVIAAAERVGIAIPRFCYHPGLGSVGACRLCAVKFVEGPVKGIQMSCMVDAADGMVVSTVDEEAVSFRKHVIEWLMENHPHDCPVCDEGGECLLQDMTVSGGHGLRRFPGKKRTYRDQYLGVFIQHEMNRCIHCWRCRRFYQEFAGYRDLGAMQIANRTYFGRVADGPLESPFSGNLVDVCPTGVYTDKPSRFKGRRWDFERSPSICIHCSLGCRTITNTRYREVIRIEAGFHPAVNGYFICDRGRYGFDYANHPDRPRRAKNGREETSWAEAIRLAAEKLSAITKSSGPQSIATVGSVRTSLENQAMLTRLSKAEDWLGPEYFLDSTTAVKAKRAVSRLDPSVAVSMREIEKADSILVVGADPLNEAPGLALAVRQAQRSGAAIVVIDPRPVSLPCPFEHVALAPWEMSRFLSDLMKEGGGEGEETVPPDPKIPVHLRGKFHGSRNPVIICGTAISDEATVELAADFALALKGEQQRAGLFYLMPGANSFGAALFSSEDGTFEQTLQKIESGAVKGLLVVENDLFRYFPDHGRLEQALDRLDLMVVIDYLPSRTAQRAQILLPSLTLFETKSTFINQEGRILSSTPGLRSGVPIGQLTAGNHPPRQFRTDIPGGESRPAWQALAELAGVLSPAQALGDDLWKWLGREFPAFANLPLAGENTEGVRVNLTQEKRRPIASEPAGSPPESRLQLLFTDWTFGTEELSAYSVHVQRVEKNPSLFMHPKDAGPLNLKSGDRVTLSVGGGTLEVELAVVGKMAPGIILLPKHRRLSWQQLKAASPWVDPGSIRKV